MHEVDEAVKNYADALAASAEIEPSVREMARAGTIYPRAHGKSVLMGLCREGSVVTTPQGTKHRLSHAQAVMANSDYLARVCDAIRTLPVPEYLKKYPTAVFTPVDRQGPLPRRARYNRRDAMADARSF